MTVVPADDETVGPYPQSRHVRPWWTGYRCPKDLNNPPALRSGQGGSRRCMKGGDGMGVVTIKDLLEAGVPFGHQTNRWNPKMKRYIFGERNGIHIIDLQQTLAQFEAAFEFVRQTVAQGDSVLFVGTKRQTSTIVEEEA